MHAGDADTEGQEAEVQCHPQLLREFKATLGYRSPRRLGMWLGEAEQRVQGFPFLLASERF